MVCYHSLLLMNSFNKTEAAVFLCRLCFLRAFLFISLSNGGAHNMLIINKVYLHAYLYNPQCASRLKISHKNKPGAD